MEIRLVGKLIILLRETTALGRCVCGDAVDLLTSWRAGEVGGKVEAGWTERGKTVRVQRVIYAMLSAPFAV